MHALSLRVYREILLTNPPPRNAFEQNNTLPHQKSFQMFNFLSMFLLKLCIVSIFGLRRLFFFGFGDLEGATELSAEGFEFI